MSKCIIPSVKLDRTNNIVIRYLDVAYIDALTIDDIGSLRATIGNILDIAPGQHYYTQYPLYPPKYIKPPVLRHIIIYHVNRYNCVAMWYCNLLCLKIINNKGYW